MIVAKAERLILRCWRYADRKPFARINADARVMESMPDILTRDQSDALVDRIEAHFERHGFGLCAVELRIDHTFIGFIGLTNRATPMYWRRIQPQTRTHPPHADGLARLALRPIRSRDGHHQPKAGAVGAY